MYRQVLAFQIDVGNICAVELATANGSSPPTTFLAVCGKATAKWQKRSLAEIQQIVAERMWRTTSCRSQVLRNETIAVLEPWICRFSGKFSTARSSLEERLGGTGRSSS